MKKNNLENQSPYHILLYAQHRVLSDFTEEIKLWVDICKHVNVERVISRLMKLRICSLIDTANIYVIGNGGSVSTASHFAVDLNIVNAKKEYKFFNSAYALTDISIITAYSNDYGYENCFSYQLQHITKWDAVIGISVSGDSDNIITGCQTAKEKGAVTIAMTRQNSPLAKVVSIVIPFPDQATLDKKYFYVMESVQLAVCHAIVAGLEV